MQALSCGMWDLVPWPGSKPRPPASEAQSPNHWTTREVPYHLFPVGGWETQDGSIYRSNTWWGPVSWLEDGRLLTVISHRGGSEWALWSLFCKEYQSPSWGFHPQRLPLQTVSHGEFWGDSKNSHIGGGDILFICLFMTLLFILPHIDLRAKIHDLNNECLEF